MKEHSLDNLIINTKEHSQDTLINNMQEHLLVNMIINTKEYILNNGQETLQDNTKVPLTDNILGITPA